MYFLNQLVSSLGDNTLSLRLVNNLKYVSQSESGVKSVCPKLCCKFFSNASNLAFNSGNESSGRFGEIKPKALYRLYTSLMVCPPFVTLTEDVVTSGFPLDT